MQAYKLKQAVTNLGYDTCVRNFDVNKILQSLPIRNELILDAGCGERGLNYYIKSENIIGTDINIHEERVNDSNFVCSSIVSLPFADNSFPVTTIVDVLEHLSHELRENGLTELVRVTQDTIIMAFPSGQVARETDEHFQEELNKINSPVPEWLEEHLQNPYPVAEDVVTIVKSAADKYDKKIKSVETHPSEHINITRILRWAAVKSKFLYIAANSFFGLLLPIIPKLEKDKSYRTIIIVKFAEKCRSPHEVRA